MVEVIIDTLYSCTLIEKDQNFPLLSISKLSKLQLLMISSLVFNDVASFTMKDYIIFF